MLQQTLALNTIKQNAINKRNNKKQCNNNKHNNKKNATTKKHNKTKCNRLNTTKHNKTKCNRLNTTINMQQTLTLTTINTTKQNERVLV